MNNLEGLAQSISRRIDAQSPKPTLPSNEGDQIKSASDASTFDLLIWTLSAQGSEQAVVGSQAKSPFVEAGHMIPAATTIGDKFHKLQEDREASLVDPLVEQELPDTFNSDNTQLQNIVPLPQGMQVQPVVSASKLSLGADIPKALLDMIRVPSMDDVGTGTPHDDAARADQKVSVLHQETHFRPIPTGVEQVSAKPQNNSLLSDASLISARSQAQIRAATESEQMGQNEVEHVNKLRSRDGGTHLPSVNNGEHPSNMQRSDAIIQKVATTIAAFEAGAVSEASAQEPGSNFSIPITSAKASEGVLRVLDIQLRPAELGVVTVRMRLNGDSLEMELHASESETAELLKKDSEKLANLLRTSGYRPDVITVHTTGADASQQNGAYGYRQPTSHAGGQFGGSEGGDARHEGQSKKEDNGSQQRGQRSEVGELPNHTGGLYL